MSMPATHLTATMTLADLLNGLADAPPVPVHGLASDSRLIAAGDLFLACGGHDSHGLDFLQQALDAGAVAVAFDASTADAPTESHDVPVIAVPNLARHLGAIANRFYKTPSAALQVVAVTGTNGKTTVAWMIAQCLERLGMPCGYVGTLGQGIGEIEGGEGLTTPGAVELHAALAGFRDAQARYAAIEVSSHALAQHRVDGIAFDTVLFTNLSRDHLDYHGDMRSYAETKASLFLEYAARHRIINLDSAFGAQLADRCGQDVITVSTTYDRTLNGRPFVFVRSVAAHEKGTTVKVETAWGEGEFSLSLPGDFNIANAASVLAFLLVQGVPIAEACSLLAEVDAPPGRMQRVAVTDGAPAVYVDYAHTPAALDAVLRALRAHCHGSLWCVFGCGGERDKGKRPQMGHVAEHRADRLVVTSDNPRRESPAAIIKEIMAGLAKPHCATVIEDRAAAIAWAIGSADAADSILIAGKGHESYQLQNGERRDFSDYGVAAANLAARTKAAK